MVQKVKEFLNTDVSEKISVKKGLIAGALVVILIIGGVVAFVKKGADGAKKYKKK